MVARAPQEVAEREALAGCRAARKRPALTDERASGVGDIQHQPPLCAVPDRLCGTFGAPPSRAALIGSSKTDDIVDCTPDVAGGSSPATSWRNAD
jgi:hypothetical protein